MKILYHIPYPEGVGDDRTIYDGYRYAFEDLGHAFIPFTERDDLGATLAKVRPDFFITSWNTIDPRRDAPILKRYRERGGVVLMKAGIFNRHTEVLIPLIKKDELADVYTTEIEWPKFFEITGKELRLLPLAASRQYHYPVSPVKKYECDILYIGANLPKKRDMFRRRLIPLSKKYRVKIFGTGWSGLDRYMLWPLARVERLVLGTGVVSRYRVNREIPYEEENQAYASAKISLNFHEDMGDPAIRLLNGRTFKIPASGGFELCDNVPLLRKFFTDDEVVAAINDEDFFAKIEYYMTHDADRKRIQEQGTARALREHTYHNRVELVLTWYKEFAARHK